MGLMQQVGMVILAVALSDAAANAQVSYTPGPLTDQDKADIQRLWSDTSARCSHATARATPICLRRQAGTSPVHRAVKCARGRRSSRWWSATTAASQARSRR